AELGIDGEAADLAGAPGDAQVEPAQCLPVEAGHQSDLDVEIEVLRGAFALLAAGSRHGSFDETAPVVDVAAHHDPEHAVRRAFGPERGPVAVGGRVNREIPHRDLALAVDLDRSL